MSEVTSASAKKGRLVLLAILAVFILPFFILPLIVSPEKLPKTNKGTLIQPHVPFAALQVTDMDNNPVTIAALNSKWSLLYVVPVDCNASCVSARNNALYSMRQVRLSLQRDMERVQSVLLLTAAPDQELSVLLQKEFPTAIQLRANREILEKQITNAVGAGNIYLMSPDGYIFIYYPPYANEKESLAHADDIRSDLKKSIKGSRL